MDKKLLAAAGATVTSAAFQLSTVVWPDWIKHHTQVVWGLWILALGLWAWWAIAHLLAPRRGEEPKIVAPSPGVSAPISVNVNPIFNNNPVQTNQQAIEAPQSETLRESLKSTLQVMNPVFEQLCPVRGGWRVSMPGEVLGAVAWVHNPTAEEGEEGTHLRSVRASLAYRKEGQLIFTIETAYWLEESGYEIDLKPGTTRGIVLALFPAGTSTPFWFGSQNHRRDRIAAPRPGHVLSVSSPQYVNFAIPEEIEISIVSKQKTVRKVTILVGRDETFYKFSLGGNEI